MISENQELKIAQARVDNIQQQISFRDKGKAGNLRNELSKAKSIRDQIASDINRRGGDLTETNELIALALEGQEKLEVLEKKNNELRERSRVFSLYLSVLENSQTKKETIPEVLPLKPDFSEIGVRMKQERNLDQILTEVQNHFESIKSKSEGRSSAYSGKYTSELTQARTVLDLVKKDIEKLPSLIEWYELRAEIEWQKTVITELEQKNIEMQAKFDKQKSDIALLIKYGYINPEIMIII